MNQSDKWAKAHKHDTKRSFKRKMNKPSPPPQNLEQEGEENGLDFIYFFSQGIAVKIIADVYNQFPKTSIIDALQTDGLKNIFVKNIFQQVYETVDEFDSHLLHIRVTKDPSSRSEIFTSASEFANAYAEFLLAVNKTFFESGDINMAFDQNLHIVKNSFLFGLIGIDLVIEHYSRDIQDHMRLELPCGHEVVPDLAINFCPECGTAIEKD